MYSVHCTVCGGLANGIEMALSSWDKKMTLLTTLVHIASLVVNNWKHDVRCNKQIFLTNQPWIAMSKRWSGIIISAMKQYL